MDEFMLSKSKMLGDKLVFNTNNGLIKALSDGFFLMEIPTDIDLSPGLMLSYNFFKDKDNSLNDGYKGFKKLDSIYFDREHFQTEHILTDRESRSKYFPKEVIMLADRMNELAILVLKNILDFLKISKKDWGLITGNCTENNGTHWFACSHYRSEISKPGCATHQDTGFVTVLYIDQSGLEAKINNKWEQIHPETGYFVINFGRSFEILTENLPIPVRSVLHRVARVIPQPGKPDRISMAAFTNIPSDLNLYQYAVNRHLSKYQSVQEFLTEFNKTTWDDKHENFGLTS